MPYDKRKSDSGGYEVYNTETNAVKARHATEQDAERQLKLLRGIEHGWQPTGGPATGEHEHEHEHEHTHADGQKHSHKHTHDHSHEHGD